MKECSGSILYSAAWRLDAPSKLKININMAVLVTDVL
jgi:hypothetical protein